MRMIRGKDAWWRPIKFKGDAAIYAKCKCGWYYPCYKLMDSTFKVVIDPRKMYRYCPSCGARKKWYKEEITQIDKYLWE